VLMLASERARIARDLHDALSQSLFSIGLRADAARLELAASPVRAAAHVDSIAELARSARSELGAAVEGLRPPAVDDEGLARALVRLAALLDRLGAARVRAEVAAEPALAPERAREAYLVLQEALVNAVRHARASEVRLSLAPGAAGVRAEVVDDGVGFLPDDPAVRARRVGLNSMRERARSIGAALSVDSAPGAGTRVVLELPDG
jgi:signal transduction histidine kinase